MKNKEKILHSAIRLFNENGFVNVRLQHISDDTIISVGNIAYHFKNKEAIVEAIFAQWQQKLKEILIEHRHTPIIENVDRIFASIQSVQEIYTFFYTDILEIKRSYSELFNQIQQFLSWQTLWFKEVLRFNIARGAMLSFDEYHIDFVAQQIVQQIHSWPAQKLIWQQVLSISGENLSVFIWKFLTPYLTIAGKDELEIYLSQKIRLDIESQ